MIRSITTLLLLAVPLHAQDLIGRVEQVTQDVATLKSDVASMKSDLADIKNALVQLRARKPAPATKAGACDCPVTGVCVCGTDCQCLPWNSVCCDAAAKAQPVAIFVGGATPRKVTGCRTATLAAWPTPYRKQRFVALAVPDGKGWFNTYAFDENANVSVEACTQLTYQYQPTFQPMMFSGFGGMGGCAGGS